MSELLMVESSFSLPLIRFTNDVALLFLESFFFVGSSLDAIVALLLLTLYHRRSVDEAQTHHKHKHATKTSTKR